MLFYANPYFGIDTNQMKKLEDKVRELILNPQGRTIEFSSVVYSDEGMEFAIAKVIPKSYTIVMGNYKQFCLLRDNECFRVLPSELVIVSSYVDSDCCFVITNCDNLLGILLERGITTLI
jgi:hypothetical protein